MLDVTVFRRIVAAWRAMSATDRVRSTFWLMSVVGVLRLAVELPRQQNAVAVPLWLPVLGVAGLLTLSTWGWRHRRFPYWTIVSDALLLLAIGAPLDNPVNLTGVLQTTLLMRNLYGRHIPAVIRTVCFGAVVIGLTYLPQATESAHNTGNVFFFLVPSMVMTTITMRILADCLEGLEASQSTNAALAAAAGQMLATDRPERVAELVEQAATTIVPGAVVTLALDDVAPGAQTTQAATYRLVLPLARTDRVHGHLVIEASTIVAGLQRGTLETLVAHATSALDAIELRSMLNHRANHDPLTELANRGLFTEALTRAMERPGRWAAVIFIDLDNFKWVNDTLGHAAGDALLIEVGDRLRRCVRGTEIVARLGGDEFAVLVTDVADTAGATAVAERVRVTLRKPLDLAGHRHRVTCSIGVAADVGVGPGEPAATRAEQLLRNADVAMYESKVTGKNRYSVFSAARRLSPAP